MSIDSAIERKRRGGALPGDEIRALMVDYMADTISDAAMAELLRAICEHGMDLDETVK